jgi:hypothetical protein
MIPTIGRWADAPDLIEPIVGYRAWRYTISEGVQLFPLNAKARLLPKSEWEDAWAAWVTSSCQVPGDVTHLAPDEDCTCGFYALKSPENVAEFTAAIIFQSAASRAEGGEEAVLGRVLLAGKVIEHETGYRAERARIAELIPTTTDGGMTRSLAARLGLPVGPTLDTAAVLDEMRIGELGTTGRSRRLGHIEHILLKFHLRHFRLIQGTRDD